MVALPKTTKRVSAAQQLRSNAVAFTNALGRKAGIHRIDRHQTLNTAFEETPAHFYFDHLATDVRSTTTLPPFITHRTFRMTTPMSCNGSPSTATMSAKYPGARAGIESHFEHLAVPILAEAESSRTHQHNHFVWDLM
jgi:hypothetical protein